MIKKLMLFLTGCMCLLWTDLQAQFIKGLQFGAQTDSTRASCGTTGKIIDSINLEGSAMIIPSPFPSNAIDTCGRFRIYYYDKAYHPGQGFDDALVGATRRSTLCSVLSYIQSVYDFSNIPSGEYIRLQVDTSFTTAHPMMPDKGYVAYGVPFYTYPAVSGGIVHGYAQDFILSGTDPASSGDFHLYIRLNFDITIPYYKLDIDRDYPVNVASDFNNGLGSVQECQFDLFTCCLHAVNHGIGYFGMRTVSHGGVWTTSYFSDLDTASQTGTDPYSSPTAFTGPLSPSYLITGLPGKWLDKSPAPYRTSIFLNHFYRSYDETRVSMGDFEDHTLEFHYPPGFMIREYSKPELKIGHEILGYDFNPTAFSASGTTSLYYANKRPWWSRCYDFKYNKDCLFNDRYIDTFNADFTMTNDISSSLTINLYDDTSLHDDDGDVIRIIPTSVVNFMGCGDGSGNNHNAITLSNGNRTLTYTPRHNFYGRAVVGFNLTDGKEKGSFVYYIIDVEKGTNVSIAYGNNLVLNGNFEEGTEMKVKGHELVNNASALYYTGNTIRLRNGNGFTDCHPHSNPPVVKNSYVECQDASQYKTYFGHPWTSFPWSWDYMNWKLTSTVLKYRTPYETPVTGNRFSSGYAPSLYYLGDTVRHCRSYLLELDATRTHLNESARLYDAIDTLKIGFTDKKYIGKQTAEETFMIEKLPPVILPMLDTNWMHISVPFTYCNDTPSTVLYLSHTSLTYPEGRSDRLIFSQFPYMMLDNVSLKEQELTVKILDSTLQDCTTRLTPDISSINSCYAGFTYEWRTLDGKLLSTSKIMDVSPSKSMTYTLSVFNGCVTARDTITVSPSSCPCGFASVFGDSVGYFTLTGGSVKSLPASNYYYITNDISIDADITFKNANVLIKKNVKIDVAENAKLTLDSAHLFTCPDSSWMWKGITLKSGPSSSARIEVKNNCLIEDALYAIDASNLKTPASGDVISVTYSTFNRNQVDISMYNYKVSSPARLPITIKGNLFTARKFYRSSIPGYPLKWMSTRTLKAATAITDSKPPYYISKTPALTKAKCKDTTIFSYVGVRATDIGVTSSTGAYLSEIWIGEGIASDDYNLFDNHHYGVASYNSNITLYHNHFINISRLMNPIPYSPSVPVQNGMAVLLQAGKTNDTRAQVLPSLVSGNLLNKFHDCFMGIYTENISTLNISATNMTTSNKAGAVAAGAAYTSETYAGYGIMSHCEGIQKSTSITGNVISNVNVGMQLAMVNPKAGAVTVVNSNYLYSENPDLSYAPFRGRQCMSKGIDLYASGGVKGIANTATLADNRLTKVLNGILIQGLTNVKCSTTNNIITLWDTLTPVSTAVQYGIQANTNNELTISGNTISTPTLSANGDRIRGVMGGSNTVMRICGNSTTNIGRGFEFSKGAAQTGTRWIGNTMTNGYKGMVLASDIGDQGFTYDYDRMFPPTFWGATGNKWTGFWSLASSKFQTVGSDYTNTTNSKLWVKDIPGGTVERPTVNYSTPGTPSIPYLYNYSGTTGSIRTTQKESNCPGAIYPRKVVVVTKGGPKMLGTLILADSLGYDSTYRVRQWMNQLSLYELGSIDPEQRDSSAALDSFMNEAAGSRFGWLTDIESAINSDDISTAQTLLNNPVQAMGRVVVNGDLIITDYTEADNVVSNYSNYYAAYLAYLLGTMTGSDSATIQAIADKCPVKDGAVVYKARSLRQMLGFESLVYNDDSCEYNNGQYRITPNGVVEGGENNQYSLYPNPNNGSFVLKQAVAENKVVNLKVYNSIGAVVYQTEANFVNGQFNIDLKQKARGVYLICIGDNKIKNNCLRFIIN